MQTTALPWPRTAEDGTPLGIDLTARLHGKPPRQHKGPLGQRVTEAVSFIVKAYVARKRMPPRVRERLSPDDLVQEVYVRILRKNEQGCAYDPRRASFSKYVTVVTSSVVADAMARENRELGLVALARTAVAASAPGRVARGATLHGM